MNLPNLSMFCTKLRKRPEWAAEIPKLLASQVPKWQEKNLVTHDVALPSSGTRDRDGFFRLLLLSASDLRPPHDGWARIERLFHLTGGRDIGIVFLHEAGARDIDIVPYMDLQVRLLASSLSLPLLALSCAPALQPTLHAFQHQRLKSPSPPRVPANPISTLLPYCATRVPLPDHAAHFLSDIYPSLADLARAASSADGQAAIRHWLRKPEALADEVIGFWLDEYLVE